MPVVLVTGSSQGGIGYSICQAFLEKGFTVYASARRIDAMAGLKELGAHLIELDVTSTKSCQEAVDTLLADSHSGGKIDILVSNAGAGGTGPLIEYDVDEAMKCYDVNVFGVMRLTKVVAPHMASRRSGLIINIGSVVGIIPCPWAGIYGSSKAAIHSWTTSLAMEVKGLGIDVMLVAPGSVKSNFGDRQEATIKLTANSLFRNVYSAIAIRAQSGQQNTISSIEFARRLVEQATKKPKPATYFSAGGNSWTFWVLSWLPRWIPMHLLSRKFSCQLVGTDKSS